MNIIVIIEQVAVLAILMAVGYLGGKTKVLSDRDNESMTAVLTKIAMPALTISAFSVGYSKETFNGIIIVFLFSFVAHFIAATIGKVAFSKYPDSQNKVLRFGNTFSNAGFMGLPFIYALFGEKALLYGSIYMIPFHILIWTYGEGLFRGKEDKLDFKSFILNPAILAIIVGAIIFIVNIPLPRVLSQPISMLAALTSPLAMLILGERISTLKFKEIITEKSLYYSCFVKLIVTPLVMVIILRYIDVEPLIKNVIIIMQSLPIAVLTVVLSQKHDLDVDLASKITVVSHAISIFTIPLIALFL